MIDGADFPIATTPAVLDAMARNRPQHPFVIADDGELTYGATAELVATVAAGFRALGLEPGERVGILLPNGVRWCVTLLGAHAAGLSAVPLNTYYRREELRSALRRAGARAVVCQDEIFGHDFAGDLADIARDLDRLEVLGWPAAATLPPGLPHAGALALPDSPATEQHEALLMFTSGSTAEPKAVRLGQRGLVRTAHAIGERQGVTAEDRLWFASPLFFVFGCANALPNALTHGATLCVQERFEPAGALEFIEHRRCTVYYGVAPITRALAACPDLAHRDISALRTGTANATPEDLRIAIEVLGVSEVCNAYGMTEGYGHSTITDHTDPAEVRMHSQGQVLPTQELRVVTESGAAAAVDEPGEIHIRGAITTGYLGAPDRDPAEWFATGDTGYLDVHGRLHFLARSSEIIKAKGITISPAEVEHLLVGHPEVDEAYVFAVPTVDGDESVGCAVVTTAAAEQHARLSADVTAWASTRMARYKVPTSWRFLTAADLPLTATGKVSRKALREAHTCAP